MGIDSELTLVLFAQFLKLVQVAAAAQRGVHLVGVVEEAVVDGVLAGIFSERDERFEAVSPKYFRRQVRRACLSSHTGRLGSPFEDYDDFEFFLE